MDNMSDDMARYVQAEKDSVPPKRLPNELIVPTDQKPGESDQSFADRVYRHLAFGGVVTLLKDCGWNIGHTGRRN